MTNKELLEAITQEDWKVAASDYVVGSMIFGVEIKYSSPRTTKEAQRDAISKLPTLLKQHVEMVELLRTVAYNLEYCPHLYTEGLISEKKAKIAPIKDLINRIEQEEQA